MGKLLYIFLWKDYHSLLDIISSTFGQIDRHNNLNLHCIDLRRFLLVDQHIYSLMYK